MRVLSLFDGMCCGMLAFQAAGITVDRYVAFEYDEDSANEQKGRPYGFAALTASHNFPMIEQKGDVFHADFTEYSDFDYVVGGSPCTYWSIAQKNNRETEASGMGWELFSQYVRAIKEAKPKFFIYENNKSMSKAIRQSITETFGFEPICINSALVSAQNRQRLYWVGRRNDDGTYSQVHIEQPQDKGILLRDILESGVIDREKAYPLLTTHQGNARDYFQKGHAQTDSMVAEPVRVPDYGAEDKARPLNAYYANNCGGFEHRMFSDNPNKQQVDLIAEPIRVGTYPSDCKNKKHDSQQYRIYSADGKGVTLCGNGGGLGAKTGLYAVPIKYCNDKNMEHLMRPFGSKAKIVSDETEKAPTLLAAMGTGGGNGAYCAEKVGESATVQKAIPKLVEKYGYCPEMFNAYNKAEITEKSPTLSTGSMVTSSCAVNRFEKVYYFATPCEWDESGKPIKAVGLDGKSHPVYEVKDGLITIKGKQYPIKLADGFYIIRKLTVTECKRLQTVPEWYEFPVSNAQAYKMLGNGWTVDVIAHLITSTKENKYEKGECNEFKQLTFF